MMNQHNVFLPIIILLTIKLRRYLWIFIDFYEVIKLHLHNLLDPSKPLFTTFNTLKAKERIIDGVSWFKFMGKSINGNSCYDFEQKEVSQTQTGTDTITTWQPRAPSGQIFLDLHGKIYLSIKGKGRIANHKAFNVNLAKPYLWPLRAFCIFNILDQTQLSSPSLTRIDEILPSSWIVYTRTLSVLLSRLSSTCQYPAVKRRNVLRERLPDNNNIIISLIMFPVEPIYMASNLCNMLRIIWKDSYNGTITQSDTDKTRNKTCHCWK